MFFSVLVVHMHVYGPLNLWVSPRYARTLHQWC